MVARGGAPGLEGFAGGVDGGLDMLEVGAGDVAEDDRGVGGIADGVLLARVLLRAGEEEWVVLAEALSAARERGLHLLLDAAEVELCGRGVDEGQPRGRLGFDGGRRGKE